MAQEYSEHTANGKTEDTQPLTPRKAVEQFAAGMFAFLYEVPEPYVAEGLSEQGEFDDCVQELLEGDFENSRLAIEGAAEETGRDGAAMLTRLDSLRQFLDARMVYKVVPDGPDWIDNPFPYRCIQAFEGEDAPQGKEILFYGTSERCGQLLTALKVGNITVQELREMANEAPPEICGIEPDGFWKIQYEPFCRQESKSSIKERLQQKTVMPEQNHTAPKRARKGIGEL